jgi:hypothetical protein
VKPRVHPQPATAASTIQQDTRQLRLCLYTILLKPTRLTSTVRAHPHVARTHRRRVFIGGRRPVEGCKYSTQNVHPSATPNAGARRRRLPVSQRQCLHAWAPRCASNTGEALPHNRLRCAVPLVTPDCHSRSWIGLFACSTLDADANLMLTDGKAVPQQIAAAQERYDLTWRFAAQ